MAATTASTVETTSSRRERLARCQGVLRCVPGGGVAPARAGDASFVIGTAAAPSSSAPTAAPHEAQPRGAFLDRATDRRGKRGLNRAGWLSRPRHHLLVQVDEFVLHNVAEGLPRFTVTAAGPGGRVRQGPRRAAG